MAATLALIAAAAACGPRQVEVSSSPTPATADAPSLRMTNNLQQAVNVYVVTGNTEVFVRQVAANATEQLQVRGVTSGASVRLKATTLDGTRTFTRDDVVLSSAATWQVP